MSRAEDQNLRAMIGGPTRRVITDAGNNINFKPDDHRRDPGRHPVPERPTAREIKALQAVQDGASLTVGAARMGMSRSSLGSLLSRAYDRLKVKDLSDHHLSQDRRRLAINVCKREGWWPGDE